MINVNSSNSIAVLNFFIVEAPCGTISMTVCTLSFPTYSNILRKLVENKKTSQEFLENMKYNANKLEKEEIKVFIYSQIKWLCKEKKLILVS